jgi:hypothetical protein
MQITSQRLYNQYLSRPTFNQPVDVVDWLVAVQSQDYDGAKWALGLRMDAVKTEAVDDAFNSGAILRTHVMRPTWHFVNAADLRWLLALTAPRVHQANAYYYRKLGLDADTLKQTQILIEESLSGGSHLTRSELETVFNNAGIETDSGDHLRLAYIMMYAELEALICSGPKRGKQFTYALLDERVPPTAPLSPEEALGQFTRRYFRSRGPATLHDFSKWSGLTIAEVTAGLDMVKSEFVSETIDSRTYWFADTGSVPILPSPSAFALPNYDEYVSAYVDYSALFDPHSGLELVDRESFKYPHFILIDGMVAGTWRRTYKSKSVLIELDPFAPLTAAQSAAFDAALARYAEFVSLPIVMA